MTRHGFIDKAAVDAYTAAIQAAHAEAERKAAAGEPMSISERAYVDLHAWVDRCVGQALLKALGFAEGEK